MRWPVAFIWLLALAGCRDGGDGEPTLGWTSSFMAQAFLPGECSRFKAIRDDSEFLELRPFAVGEEDEAGASPWKARTGKTLKCLGTGGGIATLVEAKDTPRIMAAGFRGSYDEIHRLAQMFKLTLPRAARDAISELMAPGCAQKQFVRAAGITMRFEPTQWDDGICTLTMRGPRTVPGWIWIGGPADSLDGPIVCHEPDRTVEVRDPDSLSRLGLEAPTVVEELDFSCSDPAGKGSLRHVGCRVIALRLETAPTLPSSDNCAPILYDLPVRQEVLALWKEAHEKQVGFEEVLEDFTVRFEPGSPGALTIEGPGRP